MLSLKEFKICKISTVSAVKGGADPNSTPGGEKCYGNVCETWSSDYNGVNGLEKCDREFHGLG